MKENNRRRRAHETRREAAAKEALTKKKKSVKQLYGKKYLGAKTAYRSALAALARNIACGGSNEKQRVAAKWRGGASVRRRRAAIASRSALRQSAQAAYVVCAGEGSGENITRRAVSAYRYQRA
jgi:hypothetical protein